MSANKLPSYLPTELPGVKKFGRRKVTKFQSYRATYLPSYPHKKIPAKEKFPSYQATYLLSYRVTDTENKFQRKIKTTEYQINKLPSYLPTELPGVKIFGGRKVTKFQSYRATYLPNIKFEIPSILLATIVVFICKTDKKNPRMKVVGQWQQWGRAIRSFGYSGKVRSGVGQATEFSLRH